MSNCKNAIIFHNFNIVSAYKIIVFFIFIVLLETLLWSSNYFSDHNSWNTFDCCQTIKQIIVVIYPIAILKMLFANWEIITYQCVNGQNRFRVLAVVTIKISLTAVKLQKQLLHTILIRILAKTFSVPG